MHFESVEGADHAYFGHANDENFMNLVKRQLQVSEHEEGSSTGGIESVYRWIEDMWM